MPELEKGWLKMDDVCLLLLDVTFRLWLLWMSALHVNEVILVDYPTPSHPGVVDEREAQTRKASRRECAKSFRAAPLQDGGFDAFGRLFSLSCERVH